MLVWLAEYLVRYETAFNAISYITVRAILALLTALLISLWIGPKVIKRLQILKFGQEVRNDGPEHVTVDVIFPVLHGLYGEDGTIQG
ncbi:MAG: hypothetical protein ACFNT9_01100, partial [Rodentibacter sp.]